MNKNLTKIAALSVGLAMAIGVGVGLGVKNNIRSVSAAEETVTWTASAGTNLGSAISSQGSTATGTISTGSYSWNYTRTLVWLKSGSSDYVAFQGSTWIQLGSSKSLESLELTTSAISGTIKSVTVVAATAGTHTLTVDVGGTKYFNGESLTTYTSNASATNPDPANCVKTATGTSSGAITITIASSNTTTGKAMLIRSISITAESSGPVLKNMRIQTNTHGVGPFVGDLADTSTRTLLAWDIDDGTALRSGCSWLVSDMSVIDYTLNGETWFFWTPKAAGTTTITVSCDGFRDATATITVYDAVPNPVQNLYTLSSGVDASVFGYYAGFMDGTGPVIMDGDYGIVIYDKTADVSTYVENETILHVAGTMDAFHGLVQFKDATIEKATGNLPSSFTPAMYAVQGGETAEYASRKITVTGIPSIAEGSKGDFTSDPGTNDITMVFTHGGSTTQVFFKKAAQTAHQDVYAEMTDAVADGTSVTVKGFTSYFDGFQIQMNGMVEVIPDYTAEQFAQDLLNQTDAICEDYDGVTNNHDALVAVWNDLQGATKYPALPEAQKTILANADRDPEGTVVEQAMARYDYLTGKYSLANFIEGRTPVAFAHPYTELANENNNANTMTIVIIALASVAALSIATLLVIKKRKHN